MNFKKEDFLSKRKEFSLGFLTTESFHPLTNNLSIECNQNLDQAILSLKNVDAQALEKLKSYSQNIFKLQQKCQKTFAKGAKVFLSGCGATGRLAINIEKIYRETHKKNNIVSFMAGGDFALIKSVESFEDNFSYGKKQLIELGFDKEDLLIAITEGGETNFVLGSAQGASELSETNPSLLFCNPIDQLEKINRVKTVFDNPKIDLLSIESGPMAISGSTRMQASTVLMIAVGFGVLYEHNSLAEFEKDFFEFIESLKSLQYDFLKKFIQAESQTYLAGEFVQYISDENLSLTILTDTTERSPTFNLKAFENKADKDLSLAYLSLQNRSDDQLAWEKMLGRKPRSLEWSELGGKVSLEEIYKFDISLNSLKRRKTQLGDIKEFRINLKQNNLEFHFSTHKYLYTCELNSYFYQSMALKLFLNTHSTLVMGILSRYEGNMMSYVRASNFKLIDRAFRYIEAQLESKGFNIDENKILDEIFKNLNLADEPIVTRVVNNLINSQN